MSNNNSHDDAQLGPPMSVPEIPPLRVWDVVQRQGSWCLERSVVAHDIEVGPSGIRWLEFFKDEHGMPGNRTTLTILKPTDGWLEYEERKPEPKPVIVLPREGIVLQ